MEREKWRVRERQMESERDKWRVRERQMESERETNGE